MLGDRNSRIKDFFDLHHLASRFEFDRATLVEALRRTFARRRTPVPAEEPIVLRSAGARPGERHHRARGGSGSAPALSTLSSTIA